eukprot:TRINITY_DN1187_c3_g1_i1.p2 TRINITY_DN1187_c3_g1~~TRINITY_DN1187_c3_g1_i1.p2  ORF type:complete len:245 (-),score=-8.72 TRINITY_DN1187_c3_g1_i1:101-757(-)
MFEGQPKFFWRLSVGQSQKKYQNRGLNMFLENRWLIHKSNIQSSKIVEFVPTKFGFVKKSKNQIPGTLQQVLSIFKSKYLCTSQVTKHIKMFAKRQFFHTHTTIKLCVSQHIQYNLLKLKTRRLILKMQKIIITAWGPDYIHDNYIAVLQLNPKELGFCRKKNQLKIQFMNYILDYCNKQQFHQTQLIKQKYKQKVHVQKISMRNSRKVKTLQQIRNI